MDIGAVAAFALTSFLIELTPGPNMAYLAVVAATEGRRPGFAAVAGVALGLSIIGIAAAYGLTAIINAEPVLFQGLRWAGVAYLLWLAWDGWRGADEHSDLAAAGSSLRLYFRRGLITNLLNPKAAVFYVAVLPTFLDQTGDLLRQTLILSLVYVAVATGIHAAIVALAGTARAFLTDEARIRVVQKTLAIALAMIAIWFAWKTRG
jgi:threonine/homoserine/homoserine lactone efflux protein